MKILIVNKFLYPNGGSETYIFKLGKKLQALGNEVQYFGMEHEGRCVSNHAEQYTADMDFHTNSILKKLTYPFKTVYSSDAKKKMLCVLEDFNPDVVHLNNFNYQLTPSIIYAVKKYEKKHSKKVKLIYTAHDYQLICPNHMLFNSQGEICEKCINGSYFSCVKQACIHSSKAKSIIGFFEATFYKLLKPYKHIDLIICPSRFMKTKLDYNPQLKGKTTVLHNFIDEVKKTSTPKEDYVLYFGRYDREKGVETLIASKIPFVFAGSGKMEEEINSCPQIKNVGFQSGEKLEMLIRKAACSVYPSIWYENCPFSVMESIMYGTPVIGANIGGIPELIDKGKTGLLFEAGNEKELADAINTVKSNKTLAREMAENCLAKRFDTVKEYTEKYLSLLEEI